MITAFKCDNFLKNLRSTIKKKIKFTCFGVCMYCRETHRRSKELHDRNSSIYSDVEMGPKSLRGDNMDFKPRVLGNDQIQIVSCCKIANHCCIDGCWLVCRHYIVVSHVLPGGVKTHRPVDGRNGAAARHLSAK